MRKDCQLKFAVGRPALNQYNFSKWRMGGSCKYMLS